MKESELELRDKILFWLSHGESGESSKAMAFCAIGDKDATKSYPLDPSDFNRCLKLVEMIPEIKNYFPEITLLSKEWAKIIFYWDRLERCFLNECGNNWEKSNKAHHTYKLMKEILKDGLGKGKS